MDNALGTIIAALAIMSLVAFSAQVIAFARSKHNK